MMQAYRTEGNYRSAARLSPAELRAAMANREILQATALAFGYPAPAAVRDRRGESRDALLLSAPMVPQTAPCGTLRC